MDQVSQEAVFDAMNAAGAVDEITLVRAYFVTDAKQLSSNYEALVKAIQDARLTTDIEGVIRRLCQVSTKFQDDSLVTEFEFSFRKLLTN
jgi:archaellum biogenesis ATPase FlaH